MINRIRKIYNPPVFQGNLRKKNYFEGWYYKFVSNGGQRFAFIPGISLNENDSHAFIQYIDGESGKTDYARFPVNEFEFDRKKLFLKVGRNTFTDQFAEISIDQGSFNAEGKVHFSRMAKLPVKIFSPGIMGWYSFVPFMECYHGLVSLDHELTGNMQIGKDTICLDHGRGYIEKDWGTSFPRSWIWMQTNNFIEEGTSFMFSLAKIPWLKGEFDGFLCVFLHKGEIFRFATYTGSRIEKLIIEGNMVRAQITDGKYNLRISMEKDKAGRLAAPVMGQMNRTIHESLNSKVHLEFRRENNIIFAGTGIHAGCEIVGDEPWSALSS